MKSILISFAMLISTISFAEVIKHANCKLTQVFNDQELNQILEEKGYELYTGKLQANTLVLNIDSNGDRIESGPISLVACHGQYEEWSKLTNFASIHQYNGSRYTLLAQEKSSYQACLQSGGENKDYRSLKRLLNKLPNCEIK